MTRRLAMTLAAAASVGAGVIHLALGPEHVEELGGLGWGFYLAAVLQVGSAVAILGARNVAASSRVAVAAIAINGAILAAWLVARTAGLPAGETPWMPEAIGRADLITAALEATVIAAVVAWSRSWRSVGAAEQGPGAHRAGERRAPLLRGATAVAAILAIVAATAVAVSPDATHAHEDGQGSAIDGGPVTLGADEDDHHAGELGLEAEPGDDHAH